MRKFLLLCDIQISKYILLHLYFKDNKETHKNEIKTFYYKQKT